VRLEDLPGIKPHLITRLKRGGVETVFDLAASSPLELVEKGGGVLTREEEMTALELVTIAKKALVASGSLFQDFSTADQILERRRNQLKCTTGSSKLDSFLKGGVETQAITEFAGEFGSGKSQICYTLCMTANLSIKKGGLGGNVIFIDTENTFRPERVRQIAENRGISNPDDILKQIYVCKIFDSGNLELIFHDLGKSIQEYRAKLVLIDSLISLHRAEFAGRETLTTRQQRLSIILHKLSKLAEIHNVAVIVTNQVQSTPDNSGGNDSIRVTGGNVVAHATTYRILLKKTRRNRIAIMLDSPCHAYDQTKFTIDEKGVHDVEETRTKSVDPEW
jgi:DNA repair protein RadA